MTAHERELLSAAEVRAAIAHWGIPRPVVAEPIGRGSRQSAKSRLRTPMGSFLIKRRDPRKSVPHVVEFVHRFQQHLAASGVPVARIVPAQDATTAVVMPDGTYELFDWVDGTRWRCSLDDAAEVGVAVGELLHASRGFDPGAKPPVGSFHASSSLLHAADLVVRRVHRVDPDADAAALERDVRAIAAAAGRAAAQAREAGLDAAPRLCIHGDMHPGNVLFDGERVRAILDFDGARLDWRACEVANAAMHFANEPIAGRSAGEWVPGLSMARAGGLVAGLERGMREPLTPAERRALPWLMIEACALESIVPIARTGRFSQLRADAFLPFIRRKLEWIEANAGVISRLGT